MALKDIWEYKVNGVDYVDATDINSIAQAVIETETNIGNIETNIGNIETNIGNIESALDSIIAIQNSLIGGGT